ncbi:MAG: SAM-dependent methyltransferase [Thermoprotei archaeon]|nr:class I SAM-dependent methyltransferase [TACK group archaeon]
MSFGLDVPFVPTPEPVVRRMLELADVKKGTVVYDLGAGDGRILIIAAKDFGATAVGVEAHPGRAALIEKRIAEEGLADKITLIRDDFFKVDVSKADVLALYLLTSVDQKLEPKLEKELKPGAKIVSHDFPFPGWVPEKVERVRDTPFEHQIYVYVMPPKRQQGWQA